METNDSKKRKPQNSLAQNQSKKSTGDLEKQKRDGVSKTSSDFKKYDRVHKPHSYHLSEQANECEQFDDEENIRIIDFSLYKSDQSKFASELGSAMQDIGFVILENHGLDVDLLTSKADQMAEDLFQGHSREEKLKYLATERYGSVKCGYMPLKETSDIHPDLVEGWVFTRNMFDIPQPELNDPNLMNCSEEEKFDFSNFWPHLKYEEFFRKLVIEESKLILPIFQSILRYLKAPDVHIYDEKLKNNSMALRLNYYPPLKAVEQTKGGRMLGHEDVTLITLIPAPRREGLQVFNRKTGKWIRVKAPKGSIIMNTGDYIQRITNDILPSTTHRVSKPMDSDTTGDCRISVVLGVYLHHTDTLEVLKHLKDPRYPPINVLEFHTHETSKFYGDKWAAGAGTPPQEP